MANSGYSQEWSRQHSSIGTTTIRVYYSASYNAASNRSTITVTPQMKHSANAGSFSFYGTSGVPGGVYGNGTNLYPMTNGYGSTGQLTGGSGTSWCSLHASSGSISTFTVNHNSSGNASFTLGMYGYGWFAYGPTTNGPIGSSAGNTITIHENAPYTISYNANGGTGAPASQAVYAGVSYTISSGVPTRTGCTFLGWSTSSTASTPTYVGGNTVTPNGNLPLYAVWSADSYTVSLTAGTNIASVSGAGLYNYGSSVTVDAVLGSDPGYTYAFDGWYDEDTKVSSSLSYTFTMPASAVSLTAVGTRSINSYTLSFDANGGEGAPEAITKTYGATFTLPATIPTRTDYRFLGWSTNNSATTPDYLPESSYTITENSILYAVWHEASAGSVHIDNGTSFDVYLIYIDNGTSWDQYIPYIDNGTSWDIYS